MIKKRAEGFTLIEVIISTAIFSMIAVGIVALVSSILSSSNRQSNLLSDNDQTRKLEFAIIKELRNAKQAADGAYALNTASAQQLIFFTDNSGTLDRINYFIQNGVMKKGVTHPSGNPPIYNLGNETVTTVQNDVANGANPIFNYYDDTYNGVTGNALTQPVNVTNVKFINISLSVFKKGGVSNTGTYTVSAGGAIRNLKTNLGN